MKNLLQSAAISLVVCLVLLNVPVNWLSITNPFKGEQFGNVGFTSLASTDSLTAFPSLWNTTWTAFDGGKIDSSSSTINAITTLSNLVTVGTITSGTWSGTAITNAKGGTGQNSSAWTGIPYVTSGTWAATSTTGAGNVVLASAPTITGLLTASYFSVATTTIASTTPSSAYRTLWVKGSIGAEECTLTDAATITFNLRECNQARVTLGATGRTVDFTNETQAMGQTIRFIVCEDSAGSRTITTWDSAIKWAGGSAPTLTTTGGACDVIAGFVTAATGTAKILLDKSLNF